MNEHQRFNILLAESNPETAGHLALSLETAFGATVFEVPSSESSLQAIQHIDNMDLAIIEDSDQYQSLVKYVLTPEVDMSVILSVKDKLHDPLLLLSPMLLGIARRTSLVPDVQDLIKKKFFEGDIVEGTLLSEFCQVSPLLLLKVYPLTADVYIRLSDSRYLKLFNRGVGFESSDFEKYVTRKKIRYFYIRREDAKLFLGKLNQEIEKIVESPTPNMDHVQDLSVDLQEVTHRLVATLGVTEEVDTMVKANLKLVMKTVTQTGSQSKEFRDALRRLTSEKGKYIPWHSLMVGQVACLFAGQVSWISDMTFQKLILAALFHDLSLKDHDLARARTLDDVKQAGELTLLQSFEDFKIHPLRSAELVAQLKDLPADVDSIIKHHHERPDGSGFPAGLTHSRMTPLSCLFIMAHDFVDFYEDEGMDLQDPLVEFLQKRGDQYKTGFFKKIYKELLDKNMVKKS